MLLQDKVVIISGAGPGMGRKLALSAAQEGAAVVLAARSEAFLEEVAAEIRAAGGRALAQRTDLAVPGDCTRLAEITAQTFGRIDGLVNTPLAIVVETFESGDFERWKQVMEVTLWGSLRLSQAVVPHMKRQGGGSIVQVSSMATRRFRPAEGSYSIAKTALEAAGRQMALELGTHNIRVNTALMGWMWGASVEKHMRHEAERTGVPLQSLIDPVAANIPLRRIPPDDECARTILYLLSDLSSVVTGASIQVNGGEFMG